MTRHPYAAIRALSPVVLAASLGCMGATRPVPSQNTTGTAPVSRPAEAAARRAAAPGSRPGPLSLDPSVPLPAGHRRWIDSTLATLSTRERVAQMVMVWVLGDYTSARDPGFLRITEHVRTDGIGGIVMSLGSPIEVAAKVNYLQDRARIPLLVSSDVEPGLGRLEGGVFAPSLMSGGNATVLPTNMAIGATGRVEDAEAAGRIIGQESRAIGIHMAFAPVVDVNNNPSNPVINVRSFGEEPQAVARLSAAFIRGVQAAGVAATPKHFPGHGDTDVDSHLGLPVISVPRARLDSVELVPFVASVNAGAAGMMTAHIALPRAYGDSTPATLSARVMGGLLRDTLRFQGITVTDAMTMQGIARGYGPEESILRAVEAGDDILLMPSDATRAIDAVVRAVESGRISRARVDGSVRRILELKLRTGAISRPVVSLDALRDSVATPANWSTAHGIAARAITLLRDSLSLVPAARTGTTLIVTYAPDAELTAGSWFTAEARTFAPRGRTVRLSPRAGAMALDSLVAESAAAERVIVYTYTRTLEGEGRLAIPAPVASAISRMAAGGRLIVVAGGNPYQLRQMPGVSTYLVTYGRGEALERAAARAVFGASDIGGRVPVTLPGFFARGDGLTRRAGATPSTLAPRPAPAANPANPMMAGRCCAAMARPSFPAPALRVTPAQHAALRDSMRAVLERAVADGAFPGAFAIVGSRDGAIAQLGVGKLDAADPARPSASTVWDLASLTKVIATTTSLMRLVDARLVALDSPVVRYLPELTEPAMRRVTVRHLLSHNAGLPAWRPLYKEASSRQEAIQQLFAVAPDTAPGVRYVYSDLGFMLLGKLVERVTGTPLDRYVAARVFGPLGMSHTRFLPPPAWRPRIAPTEEDPWRGRKLRGEVHDENAHMVGGVSGHAGLFSTGADLSRFARMLLGGGTLNGRRVVSAATLADFTTVQNPAVSRRALGWETPTGGNSAGTRMSPVAFGHTGFTGTSLWVDPASGVYVILLTNRVNPTRENRGIGAVRVALADAVAGVLATGAGPAGSGRPSQR